MDGHLSPQAGGRARAAGLSQAEQAHAFAHPEAAGFHVGFLAGVLGADPRKADDLIAKLLVLPAADQWVLVRAIAYSGLPDWKGTLKKFKPRLNARAAMIDEYLTGRRLPLDQIEPEKDPGFLERLKSQFGSQPDNERISFGNLSLWSAPQ